MHQLTQYVLRSQVCQTSSGGRKMCRLDRTLSKWDQALHRKKAVSPENWQDSTHLSLPIKTALRSCRTVGCCYDSGHFQGKLNKISKKTKVRGEAEGENAKVHQQKLKQDRDWLWTNKMINLVLGSWTIKKTVVSLRWNIPVKARKPLVWADFRTAMD